MDSAFSILMDREKLDLGLLRTADDSLPRVMRYMSTAMPFAGLLNGRTIAACLVEPRGGYHEIVSLAVTAEEQGKGYARGMLSYVKGYLKASGARYVDIGCGNAALRLYAMFQRAGFRVIGVWPDYLLGDVKVPQVENSIVNRDMVRFRADLHERTLETAGYDASGKT